MQSRRIKNNEHLFVTILLGFLSFALNGFVFLYLTPRITNNIGIEANGYVSLSKTFVSYSDIIMTMLNSYAARYMSIAYMKGDREQYRKYFSTVLYADLLIGGLIFIVGIVITANISLLLNISQGLVGDVKLLFFISFVSFYIKTATTVYLASGNVKDKIDVVNIVRGISYIAEIVALLYFFNLPNLKMWQAGLATLISTAVVFAGMYTTTKKLIPESRPRISLFSKSAFKELVVNGVWNSANSLGNTLNSGLDLLVSNLMLTELDMGQVSVAKTVSSMVIMLYIIVAQPFQPLFLKDYSRNDTNSLIWNFTKAMSLCGVLTNVIFAGFCALGMDFYTLWIPNQDIKTIYILTVIALIPSISEGCVYPLYYIYTLTMKNKVPCFVTILGGLVNVLLMYAMLKYTNFGVYIIVITTAIVMSIINFITNPLYMCHCLHVKLMTFYRQIIEHVIMTVLTTVTLMMLSRVLSSSISWINFITKTIILGFIGIFFQLFILF